MFVPRSNSAFRFPFPLAGEELATNVKQCAFSEVVKNE